LRRCAKSSPFKPLDVPAPTLYQPHSSLIPVPLTRDIPSQASAPVQGPGRIGKQV
jgi:hypothetical protein